MTTLSATAALDPAPADNYLLRATDVWGGSEAASDSVSVPGFDVHVVSRPHGAARVGGDVRHLSTCAAGNLVRWTLADVAGHGEAAEHLAHTLKGLMRKHVHTLNPTNFARRLNRELKLLAREGRFATAVICTYFAPTDHLVVCNAGHPRPLIYRAAARSWELLDASSPQNLPPGRPGEIDAGNLPLGVVDVTRYPHFTTRLQPDDVVVVYSDALTEAADESGRQLGEEGLLRMVRRLDPSRPDALARTIIRAVDHYRGGRPARDDTTVIVARHNASNPLRMALGAHIRALAHLIGLLD